MKILITDDEAPARGELSYILEQLLPDATLFEAKNGLEAVEFVASNPVDVLFLDINMPGLDGLAAAVEIVQLDLDPKPHIVFATAYSDHAVEAFELAALDYVVKPFDEKRLAKTVERLTALVADPPPAESRHAPLEDYLNRWLAEKGGETSAAKPALTKLWGERENGNRLLVDYAAIVAIEAEGKRVTMILENGERLLVRQTLKELEGKGEPQHFVRVHKGYLVNLDHIAEVVPWFSGGYLLKLGADGGIEVPLSRRYAAKLKELTDW